MNSPFVVPNYVPLPRPSPRGRGGISQIWLSPLLPFQDFLVRFLRQPRNAFSLRLCFGKALFVFSGRMLMHLSLMLMKVQLVHARARAYLERFDVGCWTFHSLPLLLLRGLGAS